jgi:hypothetical protein
MKNCFNKEQFDNVKLMIEGSDEDYILALDILYNIEGEYQDVKKLLQIAFDLDSIKFYIHVTNKDDNKIEFVSLT